MNRKNNSLLNDWVKKQYKRQRTIAFELGILPGTLKAWLFQGYVPLIQINEISEKTGIDEKRLVAEYVKRRS